MRDGSRLYKYREGTTASEHTERLDRSRYATFSYDQKECHRKDAESSGMAWTLPHLGSLLTTYASSLMSSTLLAEHFTPAMTHTSLRLICGMV